MIFYNQDEFREWLWKQAGGPMLLMLVRIDILHTLFLNFTEEIDNEAIREEMRIEQRQRTERAAVQAAREATAQRNASDAV